MVKTIFSPKAFKCVKIKDANPVPQPEVQYCTENTFDTFALAGISFLKIICFAKICLNNFFLQWSSNSIMFYFCT
jgi:hypothetical protein